MLVPGMGGGSGPIALYGTNLSEWPSYMVEALDLFYQESSKVDRKIAEKDKHERELENRR